MLKKIFYTFFLLASSFASFSQTITDTASLRAAINANFPDNTTHAITPAKLRNVTNGIASLMKAYAVDSSYIIGDTLYFSRVGFSTYKLPLSANQISYNTIAQMTAVQGVIGHKVNVLGYYQAGDGGGGTFYWDATSTATPVQGVIIQVPSVSTGRWKRIFDGLELNVKMFGAKGDSITNDQPAFAIATSYTGRVVMVPPGTYRFSAQLGLNTSNVELKGYGPKLSRIITDTGVINSIFFGINQHDITINNLYINRKDTSQGIVIKAQLDTLFTGAPQTNIDSNLAVLNCEITARYGDGILFVAHRSGFGGTIRHVKIINNYIHDIGRAGGGALGETFVNWMGDFEIAYNRVENTGLQDTTVGFGWSFSGLGDHFYAHHNQIKNYSDIGIEFAGMTQSIQEANTFSGATHGATCPWTVNSVNAPTAFDNRVINNRVLDSVYQHPYIINQERFYSNGNISKATVSGMYVDSVRFSNFSNDWYTYTGTGSYDMWLRSSVFQNTFEGVHFIGNVNENQLILSTDSVSNNTFSKCYLVGPSSTSGIFNSGGISPTRNSNNIFKHSYYGTAKSNGFEFNIPIDSTLPLYDQIIDSNNIAKWYPRAWTVSGNWVYSRPNDSLGIGQTPDARLSVRGRINLQYVNRDTTITSVSNVNSVIRQQVTGGSTLDAYNFFSSLTVNSGDSIRTNYGYFFNNTNPAGKTNAVINFYGSGGTLANTGNLTTFYSADATPTGSFRSFESTAGAGVNKWAIGLDGTAASYFMGPLYFGSTTGNSVVQLGSFSNTTKVWLPPVLTGSQMNAVVSPPSGSMVSCSDSSYDLCIFNGSVWIREKGAGGGGGSGTVTSITGGSGLTGGTITTSGTLKVDTTLLATQYFVSQNGGNIGAGLTRTGGILQLGGSFSSGININSSTGSTFTAGTTGTNVAYLTMADASGISLNSVLNGTSRIGLIQATQGGLITLSSAANGGSGGTTNIINIDGTGVKLPNISLRTIDTTNLKVAVFDASGYVYEMNWPVFSGGGSGTVTSITAGSGLTGGTITTSGTIKADTSTAITGLTTLYQSGLRVKYSDTASMLSVYLRSALGVKYTDTATFLVPYLRKSDTSAMLSVYLRSALGVKYSDTASMLSSYLRSASASATYATITNLTLKVNISDTAAMLSPYLRSALASATYYKATDTTSTLATQYYVSQHSGSGSITSVSGTTNQITSSTVSGAVTLSLPSNVHISGTLFVGGTSGLQFGDNGIGGSILGYLVPRSDGVWELGNSGATGFGRLMLGGSTSSFPAIVVNGTGISIKSADNSVFTNLTANSLIKNGGTSSQYLMADGSTSTITAGSGILFASGVIKADTSTSITGLATLYQAGLRVRYTDTSSMLTPYLRKSDTAAMLSGYQRISGITRQVITTGTSATVTGGNYLITFDPSSTIASYTLTLPASPTDLQVVEIEAGGTLTSGVVITSLTISANSGQSLIQAVTPTAMNAGEYIKYRWRASISKWYREN